MKSHASMSKFLYERMEEHLLHVISNQHEHYLKAARVSYQE